MNVDALDLIARYNRSLKEESQQTLRGEILAFCRELLERLRRYHQQLNHLALFEVHRRIEMSADFILLRGLVIPQPSGPLKYRLCVLLDEIKSQHDNLMNLSLEEQPCLTNSLARKN